MTTIAQQIVEGKCTDLLDDNVDDEVIKNVFGIVKAFHSLELLVLEKRVHPFVLDQMNSGHVPASLVLHTGITHLPYTSYLIEWPDFNGPSLYRCGFVVQRVDHSALNCTLLLSHNEHWSPVFGAKLQTLGGNKPEYLRWILGFNPRFGDPPGPNYTSKTAVGLKTPPARSEALANDYLSRLLMTNFALSVPRLTQTVVHIPPHKVNKKRVKTNKPPLIEYKKVFVDLGKTYNRYEAHPSINSPEHKKRLHQVQGHIRVLTKERNEPHISWVSPHWRGNPQLGMILHDKHIAP